MVNSAKMVGNETVTNLHGLKMVVVDDFIQLLRSCNGVVINDGY